MPGSPRDRSETASPPGHPSRNAKPRCCALTSEDADLARLAKAIGHPIRAAILRHIIRNERCTCGDLVPSLSVAQSTVSQHLKVLKSAGLLHGEVDGPRISYHIDVETVRRLKELVSDL